MICLSIPCVNEAPLTFELRVEYPEREEVIVIKTSVPEFITPVTVMRPDDEISQE